MNRRTFLTMMAAGSVAGAAWALPRPASYHCVTGLVFTPDGRSVIVTNIEGASQIWKVPTLEVKENLGPFFAGVVTRLALSADERLLAVAMQDTTVRIYDWKKRRKLFDIAAAGADMTSLQFSPDGKSLAMGVYNQHGAVVDMHSQGRLGSFGGSMVAFDPKSGRLAVAGTGGQVQILDVRASKQIATIPLTASKTVDALAFSPQGDILAIGEAKIHMVGTSDWKEQQLMDEPKGMVTGLAFQPDGQTMLSTALERDVLLWHKTGGQWASRHLEGQKVGVTFADITRDGQHMVTGALDGGVCLWSADGKLLKQKQILPLQ